MSGFPDKKEKEESFSEKLSSGPKLDLWLIEDSDLTIIPNQPSMGSMIDNSELFNFGSYRSDHFLKQYYGKPTGLMWSGVLVVEKAGDYMFLHELDIKTENAGAGWSYNIFSQLWLKDIVLSKHAERRIRARKGGIFPKTSRIKLEAGKYEFKLWLSVSFVRHAGYGSSYNLEPQNINVRLKMRGPSNRVPINITKEHIYHIENKALEKYIITD